MEAVEELARAGPARLGEQHFAAEPRQEFRELLAVARLVEQIGAEDEIPGSGAKERLGLAPAHPRRAQEDAVALRVPPQELDRVLRPVGGEHRRAAARCRERGQGEPAAELEHPPAAELEPGDVPREREPARPQFRPVGQELVPVLGEGRLVDQLVRARGAQDLQAQRRPELDLLLDEIQNASQSGAKRSIGTPSGSPSWA